MSKDQWFREYERLYNEREAGELDATDDDMAEMARERQVERAMEQADRLKKEGRE